MAAVFSVCACFMCSCLVVKNTVIGSGRTKSAVPLVAAMPPNFPPYLSKSKICRFDIAEFRADFFKMRGQYRRNIAPPQTVRDALPDKPLLFTFRQHGEGGSFPCSDDYYFKLLDALIESRLPDIIDIELFSGETAVRRAVANAQKTASPPCSAIMRVSPHAAARRNHMPSQTDGGLRRGHLQNCGDAAKRGEDVLTLLSATLKAKGLPPNRLLRCRWGRRGRSVGLPDRCSAQASRSVRERKTPRRGNRRIRPPCDTRLPRKRRELISDSIKT